MSEVKKYKGMIVRVIFGSDYGKEYKIISEPYRMDINDEKFVDLVDKEGHHITLSIRVIENGSYYKLMKPRLKIRKNVRI